MKHEYKKINKKRFRKRSERSKGSDFFASFFVPKRLLVIFLDVFEYKKLYKPFGR